MLRNDVREGVRRRNDWGGTGFAYSSSPSAAVTMPGEMIQVRSRCARWRDLSASNSSSSCVVRFCASSIRLVGQERRPSSRSRQREIGTRVSHDLLCIYRPLGRKLEREGRAAAGPARGRHHSAMALDDRFDDRQSKATTGRVPRTGRIHLIEPIEDVRQMLGRDARSGIADRHDDAHRPRTRHSAPPARLSACGAARSRQGSAAPVRAASDRR